MVLTISWQRVRLLQLRSVIQHQAGRAGRGAASGALARYHWGPLVLRELHTEGIG